MDFIKWKEAYSLGIEQIDDQHKQLVEVLNKLYNAMSKGQTKEIIGQVIDDLRRYTISHFSYEENLMRKHGYPELNSHIKIHKAFVDKIDEFKTRLLVKDMTLTLDIVGFLKDWLVNHIMGTDKKYSPFLTERGVS